MDLRSLRHVVTLGHYLNYTRAAEELGISQPALTRSIQAVEARAGTRLFDRDRGGVRPTQLGRAVMSKAIALLEDAADLDQLLQQFVRAEVGQVDFGMAPLPARVLLPPVLVETMASAPGLRSRITIRGPQELIELVASGKIEFCIAPDRLIEPPAYLRSALIGCLPLSLLVRSGHPLLLDGAADDRAGYPLIVSGAIGEPTILPGHLQGPLSQMPHIVLDDFDILARITERSDAVWLSSASAAHEEIREGRLAELPLGPGQSLGQFKIMMYSLARRSLSPATLALQDEFRRRIGSLTADTITCG